MSLAIGESSRIASATARNGRHDDGGVSSYTGVPSPVIRKILRQAADQLSNKLSHAQHLDEVTWTTKNWHGLQMQRLSVVLHTAVAWQTVNELACGDSGIVHGAKCIAVLNGVA